MVKQLQGKTVLITGSSRGIGLAMAKHFDILGAQVILHSRQGVADNIKAQFQTQPLEVMFDLTNQQAIDDGITALYRSQAFKGVDILINNAGITADQLAINMSSDNFAQVINANLVGTFNVTQPILKHMLKARTGCIINMSSIVGLHGNIGQVNYATSKAGLIGMTKTLAKEAARRQVRVNAIAPGMFKSDMTDVLSDKIKSRILETLPMQRFGNVAELAEVAAFLAEAPYITGQTIVVDGGQSM